MNTKDCCSEDIQRLKENEKYLELLSTKFPTIAKAATEIINLQAILNLPKGTEHFLADIHGEDEAFQHVLRNASGVIKTKVVENFTDLDEDQVRELCTLIYYPEDKLKLNRDAGLLTAQWYKETLRMLVRLTRISSSKYTRSKTRKFLPLDFRYIIEEMLHESIDSNANRGDYYNAIVDTMIHIDRVDEFIAVICRVIQHLTIDKLHIVGDIYDRGPGAHKIIETLKTYENYDIQWGNHDILWMGAACGNLACIANVVRISTRYANLETIEDGYGINLLPLARFAMEYYKNDDCSCFKPRCEPGVYNEKDTRLIAQMHKAISVIQFKVESELILRNHNDDMGERNLLHKVDFEKGVVEINGKLHEMLDMNFPTIDPKNPYELTSEEKRIITRLQESFLNSDKLQSHINELYKKGSLYLKFNSNLLYHASIPFTEDGEMKTVKIEDEWYRGKRLFDKIDSLARTAFYSKDNTVDAIFAKDYMWYLWCGEDSPLFNKDKMATFERYFVADKATHKENKGAYYKFIDNPDVCDMVLKHFGIMDTSISHIINGHVPVKTIKGEKPVKANGKLLVIDGGFSRAYHNETGIAGYTLVYNSFGMQIMQHDPFDSTTDAINKGSDIKSSKFLVEESSYRVKVADTDMGLQLKTQIKDLEDLLCAYRYGIIN